MALAKEIPASAVAIFLSRIEAGRLIEYCPTTGCHLWMGITDDGGYGKLRIFFGGRRDYRAHRLAWTARYGPIAPGMVIDHICRVRSCVNTDHLRVVTPIENALENSISRCIANLTKTHCPNRRELSLVATGGNDNA